MSSAPPPGQGSPTAIAARLSRDVSELVGGGVRMSRARFDSVLRNAVEEGMKQAEHDAQMHESGPGGILRRAWWKLRLKTRPAVAVMSVVVFGSFLFIALGATQNACGSYTLRAAMRDGGIFHLPIVLLCPIGFPLLALFYATAGFGVFVGCLIAIVRLLQAMARMTSSNEPPR